MAVHWEFIDGALAPVDKPLQQQSAPQPNPVFPSDRPGKTAAPMHRKAVTGWLEEIPCHCQQLVIESVGEAGVIRNLPIPGGMVRASKPNRNPAEGEARDWAGVCAQVGA